MKRAAELAEFDDLTEVKRTYDLGFDASELAGQYFLVTGSGRYFRNVIKRPELDSGLVKITADGSQAELYWGFEDGAKPTSEFPTHLIIKRAQTSDFNQGSSPLNYLIYFYHNSL